MHNYSSLGKHKEWISGQLFITKKHPLGWHSKTWERREEGHLPLCIVPISFVSWYLLIWGVCVCACRPLKPWVSILPSFPPLPILSCFPLFPTPHCLLLPYSPLLPTLLPSSCSSLSRTPVPVQILSLTWSVLTGIGAPGTVFLWLPIIEITGGFQHIWLFPWVLGSWWNCSRS